MALKSLGLVHSERDTVCDQPTDPNVLSSMGGGSEGVEVEGAWT
jgi:hypothetical protein